MTPAQIPFPLRAARLGALLLLTVACADAPSGSSSDAASDAPSESAASQGDTLAPAGIGGLSAAAARWSLEVTPSPTGTTGLLQAVSPVSDQVVWASGHMGQWARSLDGGGTWELGRVPGYDQAQFRDVHAFGPDEALLLRAGTGPESEILRTDDGGASWTSVYLMDHPRGFLDCMDFWDDRRGLAYGDAVDGVPFILLTRNGGRSWERVPADRLPPALPNEGGFAASGSCVTTQGADRAWIATGNGPEARVLYTDDGGRSWSARPLPLAGGESRGATTVGFRPDGLGFALGGDLGPGGEGARVALSADRGQSWSAVGEPAMEGAVYGAAWVPGVDPPTLVAVGPGGLDWSRDGGLTWTTVDSLPFWSVAFAGPEAGWAVGPRGRIVKLRLVR